MQSHKKPYVTIYVYIALNCYHIINATQANSRNALASRNKQTNNAVEIPRKAWLYKAELHKLWQDKNALKIEKYYLETWWDGKPSRGETFLGSILPLTNK